MVIYDSIVVAIFIFLAFVISRAERSVLCGACFLNTYAPILAYLLALFSVSGLVFINHSKNKNGAVFKWYSFFFWVMAIFVIYVIANVGVIVVGDNLNWGFQSDF